jgi:hypothetical protein
MVLDVRNQSLFAWNAGKVGVLYCAPFVGVKPLVKASITHDFDRHTRLPK